MSLLPTVALNTATNLWREEEVIHCCEKFVCTEGMDSELLIFGISEFCDCLYLLSQNTDYDKV